MFEYSPEEKQEVFNKFFVNKDGMKLIRFPKKQKQKYLCLLWIRSLFDDKRKYSEKEVNQILKNIYEDYVLVRRYMVDFALINRRKDGREYWL